jgi:hypothetical protein
MDAVAKKRCGEAPRELSSAPKPTPFVAVPASQFFAAHTAIPSVTSIAKKDALCDVASSANMASTEGLSGFQSAVTARICSHCGGISKAPSTPEERLRISEAEERLSVKLQALGRSLRRISS